MKFRYIVVTFVVIAVAIGAFLLGRDSDSRTTAPGLAPQSPKTTKGPIGAASGDVEYICTNATDGPGTNYSAAVAAVADGDENWTCPTTEFSQLGEVQVGGSFYCTATVTDTFSGDTTGTFGPYAAKIGNYTMSGVAGSYYGAYCVAPQSSAYQAEASAEYSSTTYSMTSS
jgi:hypothetical protein